MSYTINLTNGTILTTVADGTINSTSSSLTLIGKNYSGYGAFLNENLVHILENASNATPPPAPLTGQLWWDASGNLSVYTGSQFMGLAAIRSNSIAPTGAKTGYQWWDTVNQQFYVYNGSSWTLVGPTFSSQQGTSGVVVENIVDTGSTSHVALSLYTNNTRVAIISNANAYTPSVSISGFATVNPGFNLSSNIAGNILGAKYWGTADNSEKLGGYGSSSYALISGSTFTGDLATQTSLKVGSGNILVGSADGSTAQITNSTNTGDIAIRVGFGGVTANAVQIIGSTGAVNLTNVLAVSGNVTSSGYLFASKNENSTSTTTGALRVTGGAGISGNVFVGGNVSFKDSSSNYVSIKAPTTAGGSYTLTLPTTAGSASQFLTTDGSGGLSWTTSAAFNGGTITNPLYINDSTVSTSTSTGALRVSGGAGIAGNVYAGGNVVVSGNVVASANVVASGNVVASANVVVSGNVLVTRNIGINTSTPGANLDVKGTIRLSGSTSGYVGLSPAAAAGSTTYTLPSADGSVGQVLATNGSGGLSWSNGNGIRASVHTSSGTFTVPNGVTAIKVTIVGGGGGGVPVPGPAGPRGQGAAARYRAGVRRALRRDVLLQVQELRAARRQIAGPEGGDRAAVESDPGTGFLDRDHRRQDQEAE